MTRWFVAGWPTLAAARLDTWNTSEPGLTAPDSTARTTMVV